jgi:hypothetical protein
MKADGLLARNWLRGELGDAMHAVLCGAGHNLRMILRYLRVLGWPVAAALAWLPLFLGWLLRPPATADAQIAPAENELSEPTTYFCGGREACDAISYHRPPRQLIHSKTYA